MVYPPPSSFLCVCEATASCRRFSPGPPRVLASPACEAGNRVVYTAASSFAPPLVVQQGSGEASTRHGSIASLTLPCILYRVRGWVALHVLVYYPARFSRQGGEAMQVGVHASLHPTGPQHQPLLRLPNFVSLAKLAIRRLEYSRFAGRRFASFLLLR